MSARKWIKMVKCLVRRDKSYALNPPIRASLSGWEEAVKFKLQEDYFHFIRKLVKGGAGPDTDLSLCRCLNKG